MNTRDEIRKLAKESAIKLNQWRGKPIRTPDPVQIIESAILEGVKLVLSELVEEMENNKRGGICDGVYDVCVDMVLKKLASTAP